jgi:hypothetical protein
MLNFGYGPLASKGSVTSTSPAVLVELRQQPVDLQGARRASCLLNNCDTSPGFSPRCRLGQYLALVAETVVPEALVARPPTCCTIPARGSSQILRIRGLLLTAWLIADEIAKSKANILIGHLSGVQVRLGGMLNYYYRAAA